MTTYWTSQFLVDFFPTILKVKKAIWNGFTIAIDKEEVFEETFMVCKQTVSNRPEWDEPHAKLSSCSKRQQSNVFTQKKIFSYGKSLCLCSFWKKTIFSHKHIETHFIRIITEKLKQKIFAQPSLNYRTPPLPFPPPLVKCPFGSWFQQKQWKMNCLNSKKNNK